VVALDTKERTLITEKTEEETKKELSFSLGLPGKVSGGETHQKRRIITLRRIMTEDTQDEDKIRKIHESLIGQIELKRKQRRADALKAHRAEPQ
jgi:hypothetical protein